MFSQNTSVTQGSQPAADCSGMYSFLQEGEFLQLSIGDHGEVTGFVSRYSDAGGEHRTFVDHFLKEGRLIGDKLTFTTQEVQNLSYEFKGAIERGSGKDPADEGYYVLKGELTQFKSDPQRKTAPKARDGQSSSRSRKMYLSGSEFKAKWCEFNLN